MRWKSDIGVAVRAFRTGAQMSHNHTHMRDNLGSRAIVKNLIEL